MKIPPAGVIYLHNADDSDALSRGIIRAVRKEPLAYAVQSRTGSRPFCQADPGQTHFAWILTAEHLKTVLEKVGIPATTTAELHNVLTTADTRVIQRFAAVFQRYVRKHQAEQKPVTTIDLKA